MTTFNFILILPDENVENLKMEMIKSFLTFQVLKFISKDDGQGTFYVWIIKTKAV